jgi:hypothetical protein
LLEIGHQPTPLEHLGEDVGYALARYVRSAQLGDRVVTVLAEDSGEEPIGPLETNGILRRMCLYVVNELVEEKTANRLGRTGVSSKQRTLDDLWEVGENEDRTIDIAEVRPEETTLLGGESFGRGGGLVHTV